MRNLNAATSGYHLPFRRKKLARRNEEDRRSGGPSYMVLYANLMMLLMTFFIVLVSMGSVEEERVKVGVGAFRKALFTGGLGILWEKRAISFDYLIEQEKMKIKQRISTSLKETLGKEMEEQRITVVTIKEGVVLKLPGKVLFDLGKAELKPEAKRTLDKIIPLLKSYSYGIQVEGHTDNLPIHTKRFRSNWELSAARAISVVKYLMQNGISQQRLSALGYGEHRPIVPNDTPEHRALNRRIEILIKVSSI